MAWDLADGNADALIGVSPRVLIKRCRWKPQRGQVDWGPKRWPGMGAHYQRSWCTTVQFIFPSNEGGVRADSRHHFSPFLPTLEQLNISTAISQNQNTGLLFHNLQLKHISQFSVVRANSSLSHTSNQLNLEFLCLKGWLLMKKVIAPVLCIHSFLSLFGKPGGRSSTAWLGREPMPADCAG